MSSTFNGDELAPLFGFIGAASALVFSCMGAAYGTAKSGVGVAHMGVMRPELVMKSIVPVVMAGVLGIYGLIVAVIISTGISPVSKPYYLFDGFVHLAAGLSCGLPCLASGMAIGIVGDAGSVGVRFLIPSTPPCSTSTPPTSGPPSHAACTRRRPLLRPTPPRAQHHRQLRLVRRRLPPPPRGHRVEVDVISTQATDRAARRSLDGLVACLLHVCPFLSPAGALWQLSRSRADLRVAVASARSDSVRCTKPSILHAAEPELVDAAFQVAAEAARHPNPTAFAFFASSVLPVVERDVSCLLVSKSFLSSLDIDRLSGALLPNPLPDELSSCQSPPDPSPTIRQAISDRKGGVTKWYKCLLEIADVALCKFSRQTGLHYELHTIHGDSLLDDGDFHQHFHINLMGQPKEDTGSSSGAGPGYRLFFFAEAPRPPRQDFWEEDITICCLVDPSPGITAMLA
ncbi:V-type proton ATPase 16 kDa proteolipid subunit [Dichanthelium oligosanthes]|uniref:V-type proton ATPase proteolipid subunit n=1 Tax=Dichanthelium oligosanthes TaxID=888268 RepID=A0A1E5VVD5_9POAL|nr:V-type proton ATPase 16 kDa proteolipid subunit [Dichanthelium oligosanthes]